MIRLIILISPILFFACGKSQDYTIVQGEYGWVQVNIPKRLPPADLYTIADEVKAEIDSMEVNKVDFVIPTEYTHFDTAFPPWPWATVMFNPGQGKDGIKTFLRIFGTRSDQHKKNFLQQKLREDIGGDSWTIGKWYYDHPMQESVLILEQQASQYNLYEFRIYPYTEYNKNPETSPISDMDGVVKQGTKEFDAVPVTRLISTGNPGEYRNLQDSSEVFLILMNGDLKRVHQSNSALTKRFMKVK